MHKKLLELLQKLESADWNRLEKFMHSPFFNESELMCRHFEYLLQFAPDFGDEKLNAEACFNFHFPDKTFDKAVVNKLNSQLFKLLENFLSHKQLENDNFEKDYQLLQYYEREMLHKHYESTFKRLSQMQEASGLQDLNKFRQELLLASSYSEYLSKQDNRVGDVNIQGVNNALDVYFLLFKLVLFNMMVTRKNFANVDYNLTWMEEILEYLDKSVYKNIPAIQLYREVLLMQQFPEKKQHYLRLKALLLEFGSQLPLHEIQNFYTYLENTVKHIFPIPQYYEELFSLYQLQLEQGSIYLDGYLSHSHYRNIALAALNLKKFDWVESFIQNHRQRVIPASFSEDAYHLNMANLLYAKAMYREAHEQLLQANPTDIYYKLGHKSLLARIYFELKELEVLENYLNSFTKFIFDQKSKISKAKVDSYRLFINYFRKLIKAIQNHPELISVYNSGAILRSEQGKKSFKKLLRQIHKENVFYGKQWLLEQIGELVG